MKLIDTTIILYSLGKEHPLKEPCRNVIYRVITGDISANIDVETIQEVFHIYASRNERQRAVKAGRYLLEIFPEPFQISKNEIFLAISLLDRYPALVARDAIHAAVVMSNKLSGIISEDKDFDMIKGIKRFRCKDF